MLQNVELCIGRKKKRGFAAVKLQNVSPIGLANGFSQGDAAKCFILQHPLFCVKILLL